MPDMEAGTVARLFVNEFVVRYGAPACLHTDIAEILSLML